jgi:hypothetical protein
MKSLLSTSFLLMTLFCSAGAEDFAPPKAYPVERYVEGWMKNPFTLKTAPVAVQRESFAKDLVLGSITKIGDAAKVVVINTKTHVRTPLSDGEDSASGMRIKSVHLEDSRKDTFVEIEAGAESAVLRYDEGVLKAQASHQNQPGNSNQPVVANNGAVMAPPMPGAANNNPAVRTNFTAVPNGTVSPPPMGGMPSQVHGAGVPTVPKRRMLNVPTPIIPTKR